MNVSAASARCPLLQLCYVRLAVQTPQPAAAFATDVLGLQHVPSDLEPFLYRSDQRYYTLCFTTDADRPSIGIEISDDPFPRARSAGYAISFDRRSRGE